MADRPYKFLDAYEMADADIFFGRDRESRVLLSDVLVNRLVVLFARTGTGKTSLINAGVRPRLEAQGYATFFVRVRHDPAESACAEVSAHPEVGALTGDGFAAQMVNVARKLDKPIVLFFDQFEEFFIYVLGPDPARARTFIADVASLYRNRAAGVHLVFSMREEYFVEMDAFRDEIPAIFHNETNLRLRRFDRVQALDAIVRPARAFGAELAPELIDRLLIDLAEAAGAERGDAPGADVEPAQLQIVCDALWDKRENGRITLDHYHALAHGDGTGDGNIARQVLFDRLERCFDVITARDQLALLERLLPELRTAEGTKYVRDLPGLARALSTTERPVTDTEVRALVLELEHARLLRRSTRDSLEVVELSHDYLVGQLDALVARVRLIWPRRQLALARSHADDTAPASVEALEAIADVADDLGLTRDEAQFLLMSGLVVGHRTERWLAVAARAGVDVWKALELYLDAARHGGSATDATYVIDLCERLARGDVPDVSAGPRGERAFALIDRALATEETAVVAQTALARLVAGPQTLVATRAAERLLDAVAATLGHGARPAAAAVQALGGVRSAASVELLEELLTRPRLAADAQDALALLALSPDAEAAVRDAAMVALHGFVDTHLDDDDDIVTPAAVRALGRADTTHAVSVLARALQQDALAADAKAALERLATHDVTDVAEAAREALASGYRSGARGATASYTPEHLRSGGVAQRARHAEPVSMHEVDRIARAMSGSRGVLLIGSGVHAPPPPDREHLYRAAVRPVFAAELSRALADASEFQAQYPNDSLYDFFRVAGHFADVFGREALAARIGDAVQRDKRPSPMLIALAQLPFTTILTTNYDDLLEQALAFVGKRPQVIRYERETRRLVGGETSDPSGPSPDAPIVVKLHGSLTTPSSAVLTETDFIQFTLAAASDAGVFPRAVLAQLEQSALLVAGLGLRNLSTTVLLELVVRRRTTSSPPLFALDPFASPGIERRVKQAYGGTLVQADLWDFVPALYGAITGTGLSVMPA